MATQVTRWILNKLHVRNGAIKFSYLRISYYLLGNSCFPGGSDNKASAYNAGDQGSIPGSRKGLLEKEIATHSSIVVWKIPWMEEPGRLQSMGSQRVGHDWATSFTHYWETCLWWVVCAWLYERIQFLSAFAKSEKISYDMHHILF